LLSKAAAMALCIALFEAGALRLPLILEGETNFFIY